MTELDLTFVEQVVTRHGGEPEAVIPILQALQDHYRYLPPSALRRVCELTRITPASIEGISSFYGQFRHKPVGRHILRVCHGTACHVTGAQRVDDAVRLNLHIPEGQDTDPSKEFTVEPVACLGCCTLAPVAQIDDVTYGHLTPQNVPATLRDFRAARDAAARNGNGHAPAPGLSGCGGGCGHGHNASLVHGNGVGDLDGEIRIGLGSCCVAKGSEKMYTALRDAAAASGAAVAVKRVGCVGMCHRTPMVEISVRGRQTRFYAGLNPDDATDLLRSHFRPRGLWRRLTQGVNNALDRMLAGEGQEKVVRHAMNVRDPAVTAFLDRQKHIATEHFGLLDPLDLDEYRAHEGFAALQKCLAEKNPEAVIAAVEKSGLRGRGGAGFPTARKWRMVSGAGVPPATPALGHEDLAPATPGATPQKYVICNGDEGDPGAFMDRMILESFPYRVIEGMAIAALTVGAHEGIFYIRHEYPLAVERVRQALARCEREGVLGDSVLGSGYALTMSVKEGAGAFVCGEETALIASLEGRRGMPTLRPPFPAESGLWGKPTLVNNVETLSLVPWILRHGPEAFAAIGTPQSKGTKVFALAGKVQRGGLIEVPMGTTIRQIVEEIGGGPPEGRRFKAVQIGGPSGGCVPARLSDIPVDYEALREVGAIMGSGGLVVMDDSDCMVDIARYFLQFTQDQSCGQCTFCRVGTRRMLDVLDRICAGQGKSQDLGELEMLAGQINQGSLCGLGKTAPNPVLTTLRYFRDEYEAHLHGRCPAGKCKALIKYRVITDKCIGCTLCAQACPVDAIPGAPYRPHRIENEKCTACDTCRVVCPEKAIEVV